MLSKVKVIRTDNDSEVTCEVLERNDKRLKVVLPNSTITLILSRIDTRRAYVGNLHGIEFTTRG
jgi:hypothetical protein